MRLNGRDRQKNDFLCALQEFAPGTMSIAVDCKPACFAREIRHESKWRQD
ncbi:MAG TPA: hypothetical protein VJR30_13270 [Bradyrhizobium sp.]|nr:hypothetical protein [Bradyrhizobium sp.]